MLLIERSEREGWRLIAMDLALDTGTSTGKMTAHVLAAVAQMYRDQISERTQDALDRVAQEGRARSRMIPYGFRTARGGTQSVKGDRSKLVKHPGEQKILATARRMRKNGRTLQAVANHLNSHGQRRRGGKPWSRTNLWAILDANEARKEARAGM